MSVIGPYMLYMRSFLTKDKTKVKKLHVGVLGATGMVGQRFVTLLKDHPWFEVVVVAASARSAGQAYGKVTEGRWKIGPQAPEQVKAMMVYDVNDLSTIAPQVDLVFCALDLDKAEIQKLENAYAAAGIPVVSNNSAHRWTEDVPMIIPEVNPEHLALIDVQRKNHGWKKGFVVVKPNCSLQSYLPALAALRECEAEKVFVTTMQAISGSGKNLSATPEIIDNVIPLPGEEDKSEREPLKIMGQLVGDHIVNSEMKISAHCNRVPAEDGHMAMVSVQFKKKPTREKIIELWNSWKPEPQALGLPSAPQPCIQYIEGNDRPQTKLDRDAGNGMAIAVGRLRECNLLDYRFMALSHNTIRGAAGGAILTAELLRAKGWL